MEGNTFVGVDMGGTKVLAGHVENGELGITEKISITSQGSEQQVLDEIIKSIEAVFGGDVSGIGVGVPSLVDVETGIVYDVQNIPSWEEVRLKNILEEHFKVPVYVDNDANCFAVGEKFFGKGQDHINLIALIVGTGLAAGIIMDHWIYHGYNCGAGEFGMVPYLDHNYEFYCSGQFFKHFHQTSGEMLHQLALEGDEKALQIFQEFGTHLGNAIKTILYTFDPELIILGGSVSKDYPLFKEALWNQLDTFAYRTVVPRLTIEVSDHPNIAILGAAAMSAYSQSVSNTSSNDLED